MPHLTIHPPRRSSQSASPTTGINTTYPHPQDNHPHGSYGAYDLGGPGETSPVAPAYSPITPKIQPALPATLQLQTDLRHGTAGTDRMAQNYATAQAVASAQPASRQNNAAIPPSQHLPPPPPQPFSSDDSTDAMALRAAISTLQFQKKKAKEDMRKLEQLRQQALDHPELFAEELKAGRLKEQQPSLGDLKAMLDEADEDDGEDEAALRASRDEDADEAQQDLPECASRDDIAFDRIPGPQQVVRMPHINWEKYHIVGEPLDRMHEQQRKWPGSNFAYDSANSIGRGREHVVTAPWSPWLDSPLTGDAEKDGRKDSASVYGTGAGMITPTVSEHPMETRRGGGRH